MMSQVTQKGILYIFANSDNSNLCVILLECRFLSVHSCIICLPLTHFYLEICKRVIAKHLRPRSDAT